MGLGMGGLGLGGFLQGKIFLFLKYKKSKISSILEKEKSFPAGSPQAPDPPSPPRSKSCRCCQPNYHEIVLGKPKGEGVWDVNELV